MSVSDGNGEAVGMEEQTSQNLGNTLRTLVPRAFTMRFSSASAGGGILSAEKCRLK